MTCPTGRQLCFIQEVMTTGCKCCVCMQEDQAIAAVGTVGSRRQSSFLIVAEDAASRFVETLSREVVYLHDTVLPTHSFSW